jgi:hypothetical protein
MPENRYSRNVTLGQAAGCALIAVAARIGADDAARKTNLTTLYETGAIAGGDLALALRLFGLEAA